MFRCLCLGWRARNIGTEAVLKRSLQGWENAGKEVSEKETTQNKELPGPRLQLTLHQQYGRADDHQQTVAEGRANAKALLCVVWEA